MKNPISKISYSEGEYFVWFSNGHLVFWSFDKLIKELEARGLYDQIEFMKLAEYSRKNER